MQHQWAALSGLTQNFQEVLGFVKFSVGVFAPGDVQVKIFSPDYSSLIFHNLMNCDANYFQGSFE